MDLLEKHKDDIKFAIRFKHKKLRLYITQTGLTSNRDYAMCIKSNYALGTLEDLLLKCSENANWMHNVEDIYEMFEIESEVWQ